MPLSDPEKAREYRKEWKRQRRVANPDYAREQNRKWREVNPKGSILARTRCRSRNDGIPFSITVDDFEIPEVCPIFPELRLAFSTGPGRPDNIPTLDKIIPSKGYVPGNVAIISMRANRLKSDASAEELRRIADWIDQQTSAT